jgi:hypothetical protein
VVAALVTGVGTKQMALVWMDAGGIRLRRLPKTEQRFMHVIPGAKAQRVARQMIDAGRRFGITDGARDALREFAKPVPRTHGSPGVGP